MSAVVYIEAIRKRFLPEAKTDITEFRVDISPSRSGEACGAYSRFFLELVGRVWAYVYGLLAAKRTDIITPAELIDYPGQFASTTLVNWETGEPNARYLGLKLLHNNFGSGGKIIEPNAADEIMQPDPALQTPRDLSPRANARYC